MKLLNKLMLAALIISMGFAFNACEDNTTDPIDDVDVPAPTGLAATSIVKFGEGFDDPDTVGIRFKFEAPSDLDEASFEEYRVNIYPEGSSASAGDEFFPNEPSGGTFDANNLELETVYVIEVRTVYSGGDESSATSMKWAPATRFESVSAQSIKVYENSSSFGSGLDLYNDDGEPESLKVGNYQDWNLGVFTTGETSIIFGSANELDFNNSGQATASAEVHSEYVPANGLDDVFDSEALDAESFDYSQLTYNIKNVGLEGKSGLVVYARVESSEAGGYNYAKIFIKADQNGNYLRGNSPDRYIEVEISYQTGTNLPYAKR